jgi:hypothetical protein
MRDFMYYAEEDLAFNIDAFLRACKLQKINATGDRTVEYSFLLDQEGQTDGLI